MSVRELRKVTSVGAFSRIAPPVSLLAAACVLLLATQFAYR